jgi:hypothetical protein
LESIVVIARLALCIVLILLLNGGSASGQMLQGGVQHDVAMPPTPPNFREGGTFDANLKVDNILWYRIPNWLGGAFKTSTATVRNMSGAPMGSGVQMAHSKQVYGRQVDANGNLWEAELLPYVQKWGFFIGKDRQVVVQKTPVAMDEDHIVLKMHTYDLLLGPVGGFIIRSDQMDAIKTITRSKKGMHVHSDVMTYTSTGKPKMRYTHDYDGKRVSEFEAVANERGIDLKQSLSDFLERNGHPELVPR